MKKWWKAVMLLLTTLIFALGGWGLVKSAFVASFDVVQLPTIGFVVLVFQLGFAVMALMVWLLATFLAATLTLREILNQIRR